MAGEAIAAGTLKQTRRSQVSVSLLVGCSIAGLAMLLAVIGPWIAPFDPTQPVSGQQLLPPSSTHPFGTDSLGYDVFSRVIAAPRTDITIALAATLLAIVVGSPIGAFAGYYQTSWSGVVMRVSDLIQSFPVFLLAMAAVIVAGNEISSIIYVIALVQAPIYVRLVRAEVLALRRRTFIEAAVTMGVSGPRIVMRHLIPNAAGPILAQASITVGMAMLLTAGLSFIGAGVRVPTPEWGSMIAAGAPNVITGQWWASVFPGLALATTVFGFALLGDGLVRLSDPTRRGK